MTIDEARTDLAKVRATANAMNQACATAAREVKDAKLNYKIARARRLLAEYECDQAESIYEMVLQNTAEHEGRVTR